MPRIRHAGLLEDHEYRHRDRVLLSVRFCPSAGIDRDPECREYRDVPNQNACQRVCGASEHRDDVKGSGENAASGERSLRRESAGDGTSDGDDSGSADEILCAETPALSLSYALGDDCGGDPYMFRIHVGDGVGIPAYAKKTESDRDDPDVGGNCKNERGQ